MYVLVRNFMGFLFGAFDLLLGLYVGLIFFQNTAIHFRCGCCSNIFHTKTWSTPSREKETKPEAIFVIFTNICCCSLSKRNRFFVLPWCCIYLGTFYYCNERRKTSFSPTILLLLLFKKLFPNWLNGYLYEYSTN